MEIRDDRGDRVRFARRAVVKISEAEARAELRERGKDRRDEGEAGRLRAGLWRDVVKALEPFPEARLAVVEALRERGV